MRYEKYLSKDGNDTPYTAQTNFNDTALKIIDAAMKLFIENGYNKVTTRDIATKADVNLGLIPYYFKTKENLAGEVMVHLNDQVYEEVFHVEISNLGIAEKLYIYTYLLRKRIYTYCPDFMLEYTATNTGNSQISNVFRKMSQELIQEYHLNVTPEKNEFYMSALKGAERILILRCANNELSCTEKDITDLILSNYFFNLGISDQEIANIILRSEQFLENYH